MTLKSEKGALDEALSLMLLLFVRSFICTLCVSCVSAAPSQTDSQYTLYKAYLDSIKGNAVPAATGLSDTKDSVMDKTTFEQALKAGMPDIFPKFWILFICVLNKLVSTTHSVL